MISNTILLVVVQSQDQIQRTVSYRFAFELIITDKHCEAKHGFKCSLTSIQREMKCYNVNIPSAHGMRSMTLGRVAAKRF